MIIPSKSSPSLLQFDVTDQVATITFDSPSKRNALEPAMRDELAVALQHIQHDKTIRAVILTGAGGHFCSGGDLKNIVAANLDNSGWLGRMQTLHEWVQLLLTIRRHPQSTRRCSHRHPGSTKGPRWRCRPHLGAPRKRSGLTDRWVRRLLAVRRQYLASLRAPFQLFSFIGRPPRANRYEVTFD